MSEKSRRGRTLEELQPDFDDLTKQPQTLTRSRHIDDVFYVAGRAPVEGKTEYDIMFVTVSTEEEEAATASVSTFGYRVPQPAEFLKGPTGVIKDVALRAGIDMDKCYYTAACKWVLPRAQRARPSKKIMKWGLPILEDEIKRVKPKIIVALGKHVFDIISDQKIKFADAHGCWFWSERYNAHLYVMYAPYSLVGKPELYETFRIDFKEVARRKEILDNGGKINSRPFNYQVLRTQEELADWLDHLEMLATERDPNILPNIVSEEGIGADGSIEVKLRSPKQGEIPGDRWPGHRDEYGNPLLSVDCEWHGQTHIDGKLRTMQVAWSETDAVVIEFRDEQTEWSFELEKIPDRNVCTGATRGAEEGAPLSEAVDYGIVGRPIAATFERINARFIGHHFGADAPWMKHWLGIETYEKCELDTEFAQQTCDESSELGLERGIAMKYTNMGRYDQSLVMWKRENKKLCEGGYGYIPSEILHPYGAADVIAPYRAYPLIKRQLVAQRLWEYYRDVFNPFVTDVFTEFTMTGLPMDIPMMDDMRDLYSFCRDRLQVKLQERIHQEAKLGMKNYVIDEFGVMALMREFEVEAPEPIHDVVESAKAMDKAKYEFEARGPEGVTPVAEMPVPDGVIDVVALEEALEPAEDKSAKSADLDDGPGEEDGPWAEGWAGRSGSVCAIRSGDGNHCPDPPTKIVEIDGEEVRLCGRCYQNVIDGAYSDTRVIVPKGDIPSTQQDGLQRRICPPEPGPEGERWPGCGMSERAVPKEEHEARVARVAGGDGPVCLDAILAYLTRMIGDPRTARLKIACLRDEPGELADIEDYLIKEVGNAYGGKVRLADLIDQGRCEDLRKAIKVLLNEKGEMKDVTKWNNRVHHLESSPTFNLRSPDQMARWLFDFEGLTPIKSTNQKAKGLPSMDWQKVMDLPKDRQALYKPAVDKQTLEILSQELDTIDELLNLNAVGNLCKAFLKEPDVYIDPNTGQEVVEENGLHAWIAKGTGRIHGMYSSTETGRPRSWCPNTLNIPSYVNKRIAISVARCVREAHEEGDLPEHLMKWVGVDGEDLPSLRSCVKAPEGWVLVESDYATAEMVALAVISGDEDLMRILFDPDPEWAVLKDNPYKAKTVRVKFADASITGVPEEARNEKFIMHVWEAGECLGPVTEDMLLRDDDGNVVNAKYDIHWSLVERTYGKYREMMKAKVDRSAAKVLNFCVAEDELVLTHNGWKPIQHVLDCDLLWDGVEWVSHEGVIYSGEKEVIEYQGLRATRLHDVWVDDGRKVKLEEASAQSLGLVRSEETCPGYFDTRLADLPGVSEEERQRLLLRLDALRALRGREGEGAEEHGERTLLQVPVSVEGSGDLQVPGDASGCHSVLGIALRRHGAALREGYSRVLRSLQGAWDHCRVRVQDGLRVLGLGNMAWGVVQGEGLRQGRQRRPLLAGEPAAGGSFYEPAEQGAHGSVSHRARAGVSRATPGGELHGTDGVGAAEVRPEGSGNRGPALGQQEGRVAKVYDILNAGPRNRFTCQGVLVSNSSAYGATPSTLERKIESDTGVKPEEGTGERGLEAIAERQPRATMFLEEMAQVPKSKGMYRAASGRIRHCLMHDAGSGIGWRTRNSIESALGREMRNFPMQESVGATSARACKWLLDTYRRLGLKARPMTCLYDSVVTLCPLEERFLVARLHTLCMSELNEWHYSDEHGDRTLRYTIDNEFNWRWSTEPPEEELSLLEERTWHPAPKKYDALEKHPSLDMFVAA